MAEITTSIDKLAGEIALAVQEYTQDVSEAIEKKVDTTAKAIVDELKITSPKDTGKYAKGWTSKKSTKDGEYKQIVHNKDKPSLVHLLEFGHATMDGGRTEAQPHVQPAYEKHTANFESDIKRIIKNGGGK